MDVTREIYNQLGGNLFSLYSGCKNILRDTEKNALRMTLPKNQSGANRLAGVEQIRTEYRVVFNPYTSPCFGGKFESLEDAEKQIERLRPAARKINTMCLNCNSDCAGSFNMVYTGCVFKS